MGTWKKLVDSGSDAELKSVFASESVSIGTYDEYKRLYNVAIFSSSGKIVDTLHPTASISGSDLKGNSRFAANNIEFGMYSWPLETAFSGGGSFAKLSVEGVGRPAATDTSSALEALSIKTQHSQGVWAVVRNSNGASGTSGMIIRSDADKAELRLEANGGGWSDEEFRISQLDAGRASLANYNISGEGHFDYGLVKDGAGHRFFTGNGTSNPYSSVKVVINSSSFNLINIPVRIASGIESVPGLAFIADHDTGLYQRTVGEINVSLAGTEEFRYMLNGSDGEFHATGDIVSFSGTPSDKRLKKNVKAIDKSLDVLKKLNPVTFKWIKKIGRNKQSYGLLAQEVEEVLPSLVKETINLKMKDDTKYKVVDYLSLIPILIKGIQEQQDYLETLGEKVSQLEKAVSKI